MTPPEVAGRSTPAERRAAWLVASAAVLAYLPALGLGFVSDDFLIVTRVGHGGWTDFFRLSFYDYFRPLTFLSHAVDWSLWGAAPWAFHATNVALHAANTALVWIVGRRLLGFPAATIGALLFAAHASSQEAVFWVSARFDLLATFWALVVLAAYWRAGDGGIGWGALAFFAALLSKESVVALPIATVAADVFWFRRPVRSVLARLSPLVVALALYTLLRSELAHLDPVGGAGRVGKLALFVLAMAAIVAAPVWRERLRALLSELSSFRRAALAALGGASVLAVLAVSPGLGPAVQEKLEWLAYVAYYSVSPLAFPPPPAYFLDPSTPVYWVAGIAAAGAGLFALCRAGAWLLARDAGWVLGALAVAALVPVSSFTGGTRYVYLSTVASSLLIGLVVMHLGPRTRPRMFLAVTAYVALSLVSIGLAWQAWAWAGRLVSAGVQRIAPSLQPCGTRPLVLLTAPAGVGGVFSNVNEEAFGVLARCPPLSLRAVTRLVRLDAHVDVRVLDRTIEWMIAPYPGHAVLSRDLREFDLVLAPGRATTIETPLGRLDTAPEAGGQRFALHRNGTALDAVVAYYSDGALHLVPGTTVR
jgi:hypothetical protein